MKFIKTRTLFIFAVAVITSNAFSPNAFTSSSYASTKSSSYSKTRSSGITGRKKCSQSSLFRRAESSYNSCSYLSMTNADENSKEDEEKDATPMLQERKNDNSSSSSSSAAAASKSPTSITQTMNKSQEDKSALLTALLIAPPLIAKFGIVILVKIVTDMVVFPLLYLYRFCHIAKSKVTELISKPQQRTGIMKGDKINGAS